jgi:hypothetical protein
MCREHSQAALLGGLLVDEDVDVTVGPRLRQPQSLRPGSIAEEALARADDDGVELKMEGVDEVVLDQRLRKLRTAVDVLRVERR